jgi:prepilin-type N-terminal cleavage/methylation domain-containing protein
MSRRRAAFTLLELLVVVTIIAVLLVLLLASVQRTRDAANRLRSENNLRMLALAAQNFASAHDGRVPGSGVTSETASVFFEILPYIDAEDLYRQFTVAGGEVTPPPSAPGRGPRVVVKPYLNPADPSNPSHAAADDRHATSSYADNPALFGTNNSLPNCAPDGLANTIAFADRLELCGDAPNRWFGRRPEGLLFGAAPPPENFNPARGKCNPERLCTPYAGAIAVAMADGTARTVADRVAVPNWVLAADPADGQSLGSDW